MTRTLLMILCATTVWGQTSQERGKRVVTEGLAALGGERFLAMEDRVETGRVYSFYREELAGLSQAAIYTQYLLPTGTGPETIAVRERQSYGKMAKEGLKEISAVLFSEGRGYEITFRGARPLPDDTLERYKATTYHNVFYILRMRLNEPGMTFEGKGIDVWMNQPVEIVDIVDARNDVVTVYFHQSTKLPVRQLYYRRDPKTNVRIEEVTEYGKFRDVGGGVQWPLTLVRTRDGEKIFEMFSESVVINQNLSGDLFILPTGIKMLKKL
jgi:hypothetical protein